MSTTARPAAAGSNGTCRVEPSRQSSRRACPGMQPRDAAWSISPHGTPTISFSARWASRAKATGSPSTRSAKPPSAASARSVAHSIAAEDDRPDPCGTSLARASSRPPSAGHHPSAASTAATPATYADQPPGRPRRTSASATSTTGRPGRSSAAIRSSPSRAPPRGRRGALRERVREHEPPGVVDVLADQVHPARRRPDAVGLAAEDRGEPGGRALSRGSRRHRPPRAAPGRRHRDRRRGRRPRRRSRSPRGT